MRQRERELHCVTRRLPHLSFTDDEERVSGGSLTNDVITIGVMSLRARTESDVTHNHPSYCKQR